MCKIEGCTNKSRSRGMCQKHYWKWWKHGASTHPDQPKLSGETKWQITLLYLDGESQRSIASILGVTRHQVRAALK